MQGERAPTGAGTAVGASRLALDHHANCGQLRERRKRYKKTQGDGRQQKIGPRLAAALGVPFVELDLEVEREAGAKLGEVFTMYGQEAFRRFERRALERVLRTHDAAVIATGGSIVTDPESYRLLLDACRTVWLKARPEEHMSRVIAQGEIEVSTRQFAIRRIP